MKKVTKTIGFKDNFESTHWFFKEKVRLRRFGARPGSRALAALGAGDAQRAAAAHGGRLRPGPPGGDLRPPEPGRAGRRG